MSREVDRRDFSTSRISAGRSAGLVSAASSVSDALPGAHRIRIIKFDPVTGNPSGLVSDNAPGGTGNFIARALQHLQAAAPALGLTPTQPKEFVPDPLTQTTSSGATVVHVRQNYKSIPIFQAAQTVNFAPDGNIDQAVGTTVTVAQDLSVSPSLRVEEAALKAGRFLASPRNGEQAEKDSFGQPLRTSNISLEGWSPTVIAAFGDKGDLPRVLAAGPFGDVIKAVLVWFPLDQDLRLSWQFLFVMPNHEGQYQVLVDAQSGEVLYSHQLVQSIAATGLVYTRDGASQRVSVEFPRPVSDYGIPAVALPPDFPRDWVTGNSTAGSVTNAHREDSGPPLVAATSGTTMAFAPADAAGDDQKVLNIFYYSCFMHDFFYMLGFREADGNFQLSDGTSGGAGSDPVDARAYAGEVWATASMSTPVDGTSPVMKMGLVASTNRHTAFDSTVVFHEFTHGVTNRLVGGPTSDHTLDAPQSAGMGEGWSDYVACTVTGANVIAAWVLGTPVGARAFPYDANFPDSFAKLGSGRYTEAHNIGEIWCATLLAMNQAIGSNLGVQLMVDSLKLMPANPSFLDGRDAILLAVDHMQKAGKLSAAQHDATAQSIRGVFGRFGMGPGAQCNGASLSGIIADFQPGTAPAATGASSVFGRVGTVADLFQAGLGIAAAAAGDRVDAFAVTVAGNVAVATQDGAGAWSPWSAAGSSPVGASAPITAISSAAGRTDVFSVDGGGRILTCARASDSAGAMNWTQVGSATDRAPLHSPITAVSAAPARVDLFLVAADGGIYSTGRASGASVWRDWTRIGTAADKVPLLSPVAAIGAGSGRIDVFVVAADGAVYTSARSAVDGSWTDWNAVGSGPERFPSGARVAAVASASGAIDLFAVAVDGGVYAASRASLSAGWAGWIRVGTATDKAPAQTVGAIAVPNGQIDLYVLGHDGAVYSTAWPSLPDWTLVGSPPAAARALAVSPNASSKPNVYVVAADGRIYVAQR